MSEGQMPQPTPEHQKLMKNAGTWNVDCTFWMGPEEMKNTANETVEMVGPFWTVSKFEAEMFGAPFVGRATMGYEPHSGQWVSTWVDSMSPHLFVLRGGFDEKGEVLTMTGDGPDMQSGKLTTWRSTEKWVGDDQREFEMFMRGPDGNDMKVMRHVYKRA